MSSASQSVILFRLEQAVEELHQVVVEFRATLEEQPEGDKKDGD